MDRLMVDRLVRRPEPPFVVALVAACVSLAVGTVVRAQDVLTSVVSAANTGTTALATFGYNPTGTNGGTIYTAGFGSGGELRRIENVGGTQVVTQMVAQSAWTLFTKGGNPGNGGGQPIPGGLLLNPVAIGTNAAYTLALVSDGGTPTTVSGGRRNDLTQRVYSYNLGTGTAAFASVATQAAFATAAGLASPITTSSNTNLGRQFAYSGDGQALYIADSTATNSYGGIYRVAIANGSVTRLASATDINTEVAVLTAGGTDTILFRGGGTTGNVGGIDKIAYANGTASARTVAVSAATLTDFMETGTAGIVIQAMATGTDGSIYFNNTSQSPDRRAIYNVDPDGDLIKVVSHAERAATFGGSPNSNTLRMQPREVTHPNGFTVTQVLYAEQTPLNLIAGAYDFKPGDFNRDNVVDTSDLAMIRGTVGIRGGPTVSGSAFRFDLNGNNVVDWKDVKILQTFVPSLRDGDANMDLVVDFNDLDLMRDNYYTVGSGTGKTWASGDFASLDPLATTYSGSAADANVVNVVDLQVIANTWLNVLHQPSPTTAEFDTRGYTGQFRLDVIAAFAVVPEPGTVALVLPAAAFALALRRRGRSSRR
jgi:hypothetical protein